MASATTPRGQPEQPFENLGLSRSIEAPSSAQLAPGALASCLQDFLRNFHSHRVFGEPGLTRSRRHARFFRPHRKSPRKVPDRLDPFTWGLLRDVAAASELAVDVHLRVLLEPETCGDEPRAEPFQPSIVREPRWNL